MFRTIAKLFASVFTRPATQPACKHATRTRLAVEAMEDRYCPAGTDFWWNGKWGVTFMGQPEMQKFNWAVKTSQGQYVQATSNPTSADNLYFDPMTVPMINTGCQWGGGPNTVNELHLINGYAGTVQVAQITVGFLEVTAGNIDQSDASATITVNRQMDWFGGVIDSSPGTPSVLTVTGATTVAKIHTRDGSGTAVVKTADTIKAEAGAELRFGYGTVQFEAGGGIQITNAKATVVADTGTRKLVLKNLTPANKPQITLNAGGEYSVTRTAVPPAAGHHDTDLPLSVNGTGAKLNLAEGIHMTVSGDIGGPVPGFGVGLWQGAGSIWLQTSSALVIPAGVRLSGGDLVTDVTADDAQMTIQGNMTNSGAEIKFHDFLGPSHYGTLMIQGQVNWTGGTYYPDLGLVGTALKSSYWQSTGTFTVGAAAVWPNSFGSIGIGDPFVVLKSGDKIVNGPPANPPKCHFRPPVLPNDPVTEWVLIRDVL